MGKFAKPILIIVLISLFFTILSLLIKVNYSSEDISKIDSGDVAFVAMAAALVMLMTPALGFFYAGLVRKNNILSMLVQSITIFALVSVIWALFAYSLAFAPSINGIIGNLSFFGLKGV